jgi:transcriptional regulator with XRE-family HTH domain
MMVPARAGRGEVQGVSRLDPKRFVRSVTRRIAAVRRARGLTQEAAAERYGTALKNWQRMEAGQNLTLATLARVAQALGVPPAELVVASAPPVLLAADSGRPRRRRRG